MPRILVVSDAEHVRAQVRSTLPADAEVVELADGALVTPEVAAGDADLAVLDMQIGAMGGFAVCMDLRLEESGGRIPHVPVLLLLDRRADVFLAGRADAEGYVLKPLDPIRLRRAVTALLDGGRFADDTYRPTTVV